MSCAEHLSRVLALCTLVFSLAGCGDLNDDLLPSAEDKRPEVETGSVGNLPGQTVADFSVSDSKGNVFTLSDHLSGGEHPADAVVLYFTMWCPVCLGHSDHMYNYVIPKFRERGAVVYVLVDYVSGSVEGSRLAETANGYDGSDFIVLADTEQELPAYFNAAMGTVVVIDADGMVLMNEDYRDGGVLIETLEKLLP